MRLLRINKNFVIILSVFIALNLAFPFYKINLASAQDNFTTKRTFAVMAFNPPSSPEDTKCIELALQRVSKTNRFELVPSGKINELAEKLHLEGDKNVRDQFEEAKTLLTRGKEQYDRLQFKNAIDSLRLSIRRYLGLMPYLKDATDLLKAQIYLGMAYVSKNQMKRGKKYISDTLKMDPERKTRKLSERQFPPNIRAIYQARQNSINKLKGGDLIVISSPPGADLYLNGFKTGVLEGSLVIKGLPPGRHYVMAEKKGYSRFFKEIKLGKENLTINAKMRKWAPFAHVPVNAIDESDTAFLKSTASELGADVLLLGSVDYLEGKKLLITGQLFDAQIGNYSRIEEEDFKGFKRSPKYFKKVLSRLLKESLTGQNEVISYSFESFPGITETPRPMPTSEPEEKGEGGGLLFTKWWFWAIVGGCAVAATGSVLLFTDVAKSDPGYNVLKVD